MQTATDQTTLQMPTLGVLGVYTGRVLGQGGFSDIHAVLDHLYPGIMILGCALVAKTASREILRQHPEFGELPECTKETWSAYAEAALAKYGPTLSVTGPHGSGSPDIFEAE